MFTHFLNVIILFLFFMDPGNTLILCHSKPVNHATTESEWLEQQLSKLADFDGSGKGSKIITVDKNSGSGDFKSIQRAIDSVPVNNRNRVVINVHAGVYTEKVTIPETKPFITIQGAGATNTIVQWGDTAGTIGSDGNPIGTYNSATFGVNAENFAASNITFKNTTPVPAPELEGKQGVALRISADKALFLNCVFLGAQDTLFDDKGRHFYQDCYIEGSVDFIFGRARSLFRGCTMHAIGPKIGALAAHRRSSATENTGFSFANCKILGNAGPVYLGRAWGRFSRIIYSKTYMDNIVIPEGWSDWNDTSRDRTVFYGQHKCSGPGANVAKRVPWARVLTDQEAKIFTSINYVELPQWGDGV